MLGEVKADGSVNAVIFGLTPGSLSLISKPFCLLCTLLFASGGKTWQALAQEEGCGPCGRQPCPWGPGEPQEGDRGGWGESRGLGAAASRALGRDLHKGHSIAAAAGGKTEGSEMELLDLHAGDSEVRGHGSAEQGGAWQGPTPCDEQDRHCEGTSQSEATAEDLGLQHKARRMPPQLGGLGENSPASLGAGSGTRQG